MNELIQDSKEELKRVDHLIYVTLKYTRTVDVLLSIVERMIGAYEIAVDALLNHALEAGIVESIPEIPIEKAVLAKKVFESNIVKENMDNYLLFRKLRRIKGYEKSNEYRRHVTMKAIVNDKIVELNIDSITEMYHTIKKFIDFVSRKIEE